MMAENNKKNGYNKQTNKQTGKKNDAKNCIAQNVWVCDMCDGLILSYATNAEQQQATAKR